MFRLSWALKLICSLSLIRLAAMRGIPSGLIMMMMVMMIVIFECYFLVLELDHNRFINNYGGCRSGDCGSVTWLILPTVLRLLSVIWRGSEACRVALSRSVPWLLEVLGYARVAEDCLVELLIQVLEKG